MPRRHMPAAVQDVPLPLGGLDTHVPYGRQSRQTALAQMQTAEANLMNTTPQAVNVRGFDAATGRRRLSRRMGLAKLVGQQVRGYGAVQELAVLSGTQYVTGSGLVIPGSGVSQFAGTVVVGTTNDASHSWYVYVGAVLKAQGGGGGAEKFAGACTDGAAFYVATVNTQNQSVSLYKISAAGAILWSRITFTTVVQDADSRVRQKPGLFGQGTPGYGVGYPVVAVPPSTTASSTVFVEGKGAITTTVSVPSPVTVYVAVEGRGVFRFLSQTGADLGGNPWVTSASIKAAHGNYEPTGGLAAYGVAGGGSQTLAVGCNKLVSGQTADAGVVFVNTNTGAQSHLLGLQQLTASTQQTAYPFLFSDGTSFYVAVQNYQNSNQSAVMQTNVGAPPAVVWTARAGDATGFGYYSGTPAVVASGNSANLALNPASGASLGAGLGTGLQQFFDVGSGFIFFDTTDTVYASNGTSNVWSGTGLATAGRLCALPVGSGSTGGALADAGLAANLMNYNRAVVLVGVSAGTVRVAYGGTWQTPQGGAGALNASVKVVRSAVNAGMLWFADGTNWKCYNPAHNQVYAWAATQGSLPVDSAGNKPRLIETWRGRTVLSGLPLDPQNAFMSGAGDPTNFAYNPSPSTETQAVALNLTPAGLVPDTVTALVPYNDDVLIFGCDSHIYQMTGDPMAGGRIDLVSDVTGMAWGRAWCKSPDGTLYFMGSRGRVYEMAPGAVPAPVSQAIDLQLASVNMASNLIRLVFDERFSGFHVFVTPVAGGAATHYYYDTVAKAWWSDQFASSSLDPFAVLAFDGDAPGNRYVALGGQDGYVRVYSTSATDDDGNVISSSVLCGPLQSGSGSVLRFDQLWGVLANGEGSVGWGLQVGNYTEAAVGATARYAGTFAPGRSLAQEVRSVGVAAFVALSRAVSEAAWSVESLRLFVTPLAQERQRQVQ